ncbi:type II secretion system protein [Reinekea sp.]|jgi:general secretion pathway protein H|uniref:type II secretion system protein n=1 Tax=Reinekea sp. TaxID=1970455 RepID=UPI003988E81A
MKVMTCRNSKGFTLIEVLVVILIMGVVLSMISLATTTKDPLEETLKKSYAFQYWFDKVIDNALLSGEDVGLYFTETSVLTLSWREGDLEEAEPDIVWNAHESLGTFTFPDSLNLELFLDIELSDWVDLEVTPPDEDEFLVPHIVVTPSEEYFPTFLINFYDQNYSDEQVIVLADGFNRARVTREQK